jgi:hypothetical protein
MLTFFIWGASGYFMRVSKSILNSFVALNDQIEQNAENELVYGNLKLDLFKNKKTDIDLEKKLDYINQIDKITAEQIKYLDAIKIEILTEIKEDPAKMKAGDPHSIITNSYEDKSPLRPIRMNLENVMNKDKYDEVMRIFGIAENPNKPTTYKCKSSNVSGGIELWNNLLKFRNDLCSIVVASSSNDSVKNNFIDPKIIKFKDIEDLQKNVQNAFSKCKINADSYPFLEEIYISLTKNEICEDEQYPEGLHWLGKTFNHAPSISAIATLSNLQKEILTARKIAISSIVNN